MAGTINLSLSQQFDSLGKPLSGGKLYLYASGTTTPQSAYQDSALTLAWPNPMTLDSAGRIPQFFLADGSIKVRLTDSSGVVQIAADGLLVIGASSGGGGGGSVDATTVLTTGDLKARYGTGTLAGFVRANGRTIGSATSGASERANTDCQSLFEYLWGADANLSVSTGRGATADADWTANKTIALPDWRGRAIVGLDGMGSTAAGRLTSTYFGASADTLGAAGGAESHTLSSAEMPAHTHTNSLTDPGHIHSLAAGPNAGGNQSFVALPASSITTALSGGANGVQSATTGITITNASTGGGNAHDIASPAMVTTIYMKL